MNFNFKSILRAIIKPLVSQLAQHPELIQKVEDIAAAKAEELARQGVKRLGSKVIK